MIMPFCTVRISGISLQLESYEIPRGRHVASLAHLLCPLMLASIRHLSQRLHTILGRVGAL